jgi:uncharacterized protein YdeI (YjbR/CyaY-like superfamily)
MLMESSWDQELALLKSIIQKTGLKETVKWGIPVFTFNGQNIVGIAGFKSFFALWFYNGIFLQDPNKVLINAQEGVTKALRQWRFFSGKEIDEKLILDYIEEAIENEKQGKKIKPQKKELLPLPIQLKEAFDNDVFFKEKFEKLSPGKQNEYIEHLLNAKQEATKFSRLRKIKPLIMKGHGLHDKYKK